MKKRIPDTGEALWPLDENGDPKATNRDPATGIMMCQFCWNGSHSKYGCRIPGCECKCYQGRNKGLGKAHKPHKGCKDQESIPDAGTISV